MLRRLDNPWGIDLWLLVSDIRQPHLGGNKYYKLLGYLETARTERKQHLITMAGAHSNHLRAFAALTRQHGLKATAIIRGDELSDESRQSAEIRFARTLGVECIFVTRALYRLLREADTTTGRTALFPGVDFGSAVFVPEGGLGLPGITGVQCWAAAAQGFETVWLAVATGTTAAGFLTATQAPTRVAGVAVLKNAAAIRENIRRLVPLDATRFDLIEGFESGFGRASATLAALAADFSARWQTTIDTTYLAKVIQALSESARQGKVSGKTLVVYTYNE
ncbi:MAG: pyridoxal-phosphate dependent enzyme [Turneriella sp.]|nr:pyridoxal-phosphate dependent enzyme [Turneriella sp.]